MRTSDSLVPELPKADGTRVRRRSLPAVAGLVIVVALVAGACSSGSSSGAGSSAISADVTTIPAVSPGDTYVALGSSYAAGAGIPVQDSTGCSRSTQSYSQLVAAELDLTLVDASCGGATIPNVLDTPQDDNPPQISAVTPDAKLVTVTVGGNDVGFVASAFLCSSAGSEGRSCIPDSLDPTQTQQKVDAVEANLVKMLDAVQAAAPDAEVVLLSYPRVVADAPVPCPAVPMTQDSIDAFAGLAAGLDGAFRRAAQQAGVELIDVYGASTGHDACAVAGEAWMAGLSGEGSSPFHPLAVSHQKQAELLVDLLRN